MRILVMMGLMIFLSLNLATAATVDLSDGNVVQGDIIKQDAKSLQISVDGVTMTYYADEIKDIDGKPFVVSAPEAQPDLAPAPVTEPDTAAVPAPVVQPEPVAPEPVAQPDLATNPVSEPLPAATEGGIDPDKRALILKFIEVFGTRQALAKNFDALIAQLEKEKPDEADKIRQRVKIDEIIERLLPIYDRNFTSDDLKAFIAFYGSEEGQKLINTIPELMKESVGESVKYMEEKFPEVKKEQQ